MNLKNDFMRFCFYLQFAQRATLKKTGISLCTCGYSVPGVEHGDTRMHPHVTFNRAGMLTEAELVSRG